MKLHQLYRQTAEDFARLALKASPETIDAIILYGSVARGDPRKDSDIDILILSRDKEAIARARAIRSQVDFLHDYRTFITLVDMTTEELAISAHGGSPFSLCILQEGITLYDNGAFQRLRDQVLAAS